MNTFRSAFTTLCLVFSINASAQTVYLECLYKNNKQTLIVDLDKKIVTDFVSRKWNAEITDGSINWRTKDTQYGDATNSLNRYTGIYTSRHTSGILANSSSAPMKCETMKHKKF